MNQAFLQQMINHKINNITPGELVQLSSDYGIHISKSEAQKVISILRKERINIANQKQINNILLKIKREVNPNAMKQVQKLLARFMK